MAFMNAKKRNKTITYIIVGLVSVGLLATTLPMGISAIGSYVGNNSGSGSSGSVRVIESKAIQDFQEAGNLMQKGKEEAAAKKLTAAINGFEEVLKSEPKNLPSMGDLATAYFYSGNVDKAIEWANKALEIEPRYTVVRINYARYLYYGKNDSEGAITQLNQIDKEDSYYQDAQNLLAEINSAPVGPPPGTGSSSGGVTPPPTDNSAPSGGITPPPSGGSTPPAAGGGSQPAGEVPAPPTN